MYEHVEYLGQQLITGKHFILTFKLEETLRAHRFYARCYPYHTSSVALGALSVCYKDSGTST